MLHTGSNAAYAQAWLPPKGTFSYTVDYTDILNKKHFTNNTCFPVCDQPNEVDVGHTDNQVISLSASYSPTDRISVNASLPVVRTRYRGEGHGGHDHEIDDGSWHSTVTDLQLTVNYQLVTGAFGLSPYVGAVIPTHDYTTFGHSAPGRGLNEYWVGAYAAMSLHEWIPRTYVQLRGNYAFVEEVLDIAHDRINAVLEIGYFPTPAWNVRVMVSEQWTDGGINVPVPLDDPQVSAPRPAGGGGIRGRRRRHDLDRQRARQRIRLLHAGDRGHERPQGRPSLFNRRQLRPRRTPLTRAAPAAFTRLHAIFTRTSCTVRVLPANLISRRIRVVRPERGGQNQAACGPGRLTCTFQTRDEGRAACARAAWY